jgi:radical SAM superfamily enzyme YgiQ (UPF0313 family)
MKDIDLLLVNPGNRLEQFAGLNELATVAQPLGIAMIAAYVRQKGYSVAIIDAEANFWTPEETAKEIEKYRPLLIGLTAFTTKMTSAGKILRLIRERMPKMTCTVIGGHHASAIPGRTLKEEAVDFVVKGEGFSPIVSILEMITANAPHSMQGLWFKQNGNAVGYGQAIVVDGLDNLPFAAWDLLPMKNYRAHHWQAWGHNVKDLSGFAVIYTSLGCPYNCDYCSVNVVYGKHYTRYRSPEMVVKELELLVEKYGVKYVEIIDDTFTLNADRVEHLCDLIIKRGLGDKAHMWCFARVDRVSSKLMEKMRKAGIEWVFMGFESGKDLILKDVNKQQTVEQIRKAVEVIHSAGINVGGNYIYGLPGDTFESMQETLDLAKELNTEYANHFVCMAYPGTQLHDVAIEKGYPLPKRWGQYGFFAPDAVPMRTEALSPTDILEFRDNAFKEYFGSERYQNMIKRKFGQETVDYINDKVLSKEIVRWQL